jgi:cell division protein ZapE
MITPLLKYQEDLIAGRIMPDEKQAMAVNLLEEIFQAIIKKKRRLLPKKAKSKVTGLYLWGGVGIGKTYLMDSFYQCLPFESKMRLHFHRFMKMIHDELKSLQGQKDPLKKIAKNLSNKTRVLCFDEFFVNDIADAMILGNLFSALFDAGITLVTTSNVAPDNLYRNGLQRSKFLPAIELIKANTRVFHLCIDKDYRLRHLTDAGVYFYPNTIENYQKMEALFHRMSHEHIREETYLNIDNRRLNIIKRSTSILWVSFKDLCAIPRSQQDYLYIAKNFNTVFLQDVGVIAPDDRNSITYFISLIDIFYDASVKLIILAEKDFSQLYPQGYLSFEYQRTCSRLQEMQSEAYLHGEHSVS